MLDIYERVLGLKFVKVPAEKAVVWHPDVQLYECWDEAEDKHFSGYMYLDLFPRDSKCKYMIIIYYIYTYLFSNFKFKFIIITYYRSSCCLFPSSSILCKC